METLIIPENEFSIIDIAVQRVGKKDKVSLTEDKKFIIVGLIKNENTTSQTHFGFTNMGSNMLTNTLEVTAHYIYFFFNRITL